MAQHSENQEAVFDVNDPKCIRCGSDNIARKGRYRERRRYQCQDCRRLFQGELYAETRIHSEFDTSNPRCVYCDSEELVKHGMFNGRQRYLCKTCQRHFRGEITELKADRPLFNPKDPRCVHCGSTNIKKKGRDKDKKRQRYACRDCSKFFVGEQYVKTVRPFAYRGSGCPKCGSFNVKPHGSRPYSYKSTTRRRKKFLCNKCGRTFIENPRSQCSRHILAEATTPEEMFAYDIWDVRILGVEASTNGSYSLNFSPIEPEWLKMAAKEWIRFKSVNSACSTLYQQVGTIRWLSKFLKKRKYNINPEDIDRNLIVEILVSLSSSRLKALTVNHRTGHLKCFFEDCARFNWANVTREQLIFSEDYPDLGKFIPRYIPDNILQQVKNHYGALPQPVVCMIEVLLGTGMRTSELVNLKYDCLEQDSTGDYWIRIYQVKMKKEITLVISKDLAKLIHQQQAYIREQIGDDWKYLFCETENNHDFLHYKSKLESGRTIVPLNYFEPQAKKLKGNTLRMYLHRFADEMQIKDESGEVFPLGKLHQFRHTHGTELINNGIPQHIVQARLGHASPRMTSVYAHIHDQTMKAVMEKYWDSKVVNNQGEVIVPENPELDTAEMQWIKKNMNAQTLADGTCTIPVQLGCPHEGSPCLFCVHYRTDTRFLEGHKKRLEETEKLIENARSKGWTRQVEINLPTAENLRKIIRGLEQKEVVYGDEKFPEPTRTTDGGEEKETPASPGDEQSA